MSRILKEIAGMRQEHRDHAGFLFNDNEPLPETPEKKRLLGLWFISRALFWYLDELLTPTSPTDPLPPVLRPGDIVRLSSAWYDFQHVMGQTTGVVNLDPMVTIDGLGTFTEYARDGGLRVTLGALTVYARPDHVTLVARAEARLDR
jgi:hypothetical protein